MTATDLRRKGAPAATPDERARALDLVSRRADRARRAGGELDEAMLAARRSGVRLIDIAAAAQMAQGNVSRRTRDEVPAGTKRLGAGLHRYRTPDGWVIQRRTSSEWSAWEMIDPDGNVSGPYATKREALETKAAGHDGTGPSASAEGAAR